LLQFPNGLTMKRFLLLLLLSTSLVSGCGKDDNTNDPSPTTPSPVLSGKLTCLVNGGTFSGDATATFHAASSVGSGDPNTDLLQIAATSVSSIGMKQYVTIYYRKPKSSSDTQYTFIGGRSEGSQITMASYNDEPIGTITKSAQGWSGTFAAKRFSLTGGNTIALQQGTFTDIQ
jgi:hypothetical protein